MRKDEVCWVILCLASEGHLNTQKLCTSCTVGSGKRWVQNYFNFVTGITEVYLQFIREHHNELCGLCSVLFRIIGVTQDLTPAYTGSMYVYVRVSTVMLHTSHLFYISQCFGLQCSDLPSVLWCCWLGGSKCIRPIKDWVVRFWRGYLSGARWKWFAYGLADAAATPSCLCSCKIQSGLPFWCQLTQIVLEKRP